jgi:hypothetical protein
MCYSEKLKLLETVGSGAAGNLKLKEEKISFSLITDPIPLTCEGMVSFFPLWCWESNLRSCEL